MRKRHRPDDKPNPYHKDYGLISDLKWLFDAIVKYYRSIFIVVAIGIVTAPFMSYLWTYISKFVIDMITGSGDTGGLLRLMLIFTAIQIAATMLSTYHNYGDWRYIGLRFKLMSEKNAKIMSMDYQCLEDPDVMDCFEKAGRACGGNWNGLEGLLRRSVAFLKSLATTVFGLGILATMNVWIMLAVAVGAGISFAVRNFANKYGKKHFWDPLAKWWRKDWYMRSEMTDFSFAKDVRLFGLRDWLIGKYSELKAERLHTQVNNEKLWILVSVITDTLNAAVQVFVYIYLINAVARGEIGLGDFSLYIASSTTLFSTMNQLLSGIADLFQCSREVDDFRSFMDYDGGNAPETGKPLPKLDRYEFEFRNVSFKYPKAEAYALHDLNMTVKAGERLAVVGLNGAGKSTFIKLLLRLYEPTEGEILLNGVNIREYNRRSYYSAFAPVFQDVELFAFPLSENVSMSSPENTDPARAEKCLIDAGMGDKLKELPDGVSTEILKVIHDDGVDLSGGEKQKLALARALYKDTPVVVLDEPTAALDALAESKLYSDFDKLIGGKTAVYISHRLSSTQFCRSVAMFKDGTLAEYGTHDELMRKNGAYAEMFRIQAQYYVEEKEAV